MAKSKTTLILEQRIMETVLRNGVFGCLEVTIGYKGKERVDFMTMDMKDVFRCYEIKSSLADFRSKSKKSFVGNFNYYVMPPDLYEQVKEEIPKHIGVYVVSSVVKKAKRVELSVEADILKNSLIRSLYRESMKLNFKEWQKND